MAESEGEECVMLGEMLQFPSAGRSGVSVSGGSADFLLFAAEACAERKRNFQVGIIRHVRPKCTLQSLAGRSVGGCRPGAALNGP